MATDEKTGRARAYRVLHESTALVPTGMVTDAEVPDAIDGNGGYLNGEQYEWRTVLIEVGVVEAHGGEAAIAHGADGVAAVVFVAVPTRNWTRRKLKRTVVTQTSFVVES